MCEELPGDADRMPISAEGSPDGTVGSGLQISHTVQKSREIKMTKSSGRLACPADTIDGYYWTTGGGLAQFTLRILECENGWRQTNSTARFRFCSISGRLCLFDAHSSKWQENAWGWVAPSYSDISTRAVTLSAQSWASSLTVCPGLF